MEKQYQSSSKELKTELSYDPAILILSIYLKKTKTLVRRDTCTSVFITALLTIAKLWKHPKHPLSDERTKKARYI